MSAIIQSSTAAEPDAIAQRIETLAVSDTWKRRFHEMEANPEALKFNPLAFLFGPIYYIFKGMWKKGLTLFAWITAALTMVDLLAAAFGMTVPMQVGTVTTGVITSIFATRDYWRLKVHGESFWPHPSAKTALWIGLVVMVCVLTLWVALTHRPSMLLACKSPEVDAFLTRQFEDEARHRPPGVEWFPHRATRYITLESAPLSEQRRCGATLIERNAAGQERAQDIAFMLYLNDDGTTHVVTH